MTLSDYLFKYENNNIVKLYMENAIPAPSLYASIEEIPEGYKVVPTNLFLTIANVTSAELILSKDYKIKKSYCGCVQFFKNQICAHIVSLYAIGLYIIDPDYYEDEMDRLERKKLSEKHNGVFYLIH